MGFFWFWFVLFCFILFFFLSAANVQNMQGKYARANLYFVFKYLTIPGKARNMGLSIAIVRDFVYYLSVLNYKFSFRRYRYSFSRAIRVGR